MKDQINAYKNHLISLSSLLKRLENLCDSLREVDPEWKDRLRSLWKERERTFPISQKYKTSAPEEAVPINTFLEEVLALLKEKTPLRL